MANYHNTPWRMNNYENAPLVRIRASTVTIWEISLKLKSQPLDLPQIWVRSRQRTDHHIQRLVFKTKVGKALIEADFPTNYQNVQSPIHDDSGAFNDGLSSAYKFWCRGKDMEQDSSKFEHPFESYERLVCGSPTLGFLPNSRAILHHFSSNLFL